MKSARLPVDAPKRGRPTANDPRRSGKAASLERKSGVSHARWTFLTNHAHVLILLARNPFLVLREVALQVGITERAVQRIIADLEADGFLKREKIGRRNHYRVRNHLPLRHPIEAHRTIGNLLAAMNAESPSAEAVRNAPRR
jgi:hypothetical protein